RQGLACSRPQPIVLFAPAPCFWPLTRQRSRESTHTLTATHTHTHIQSTHTHIQSTHTHTTLCSILNHTQNRTEPLKLRRATHTQKGHAAIIPCVNMYCEV